MKKRPFAVAEAVAAVPPLSRRPARALQAGSFGSSGERAGRSRWARFAAASVSHRGALLCSTWTRRRAAVRRLRQQSSATSDRRDASTRPRGRRLSRAPTPHGRGAGYDDKNDEARTEQRHRRRGAGFVGPLFVESIFVGLLFVGPFSVGVFVGICSAVAGASPQGRGRRVATASGVRGAGAPTSGAAPAAAGVHAGAVQRHHGFRGDYAVGKPVQRQPGAQLSGQG